MENKDKSTEPIHIELREVYDGIALIFYPETKTFVWYDPAIRRTTAMFRKEYEESILKQFKL